MSTTDAHSDFVKALHVVPSLGLLASGGSDKVVRLWRGSLLGLELCGFTHVLVCRDLSSVDDGQPLKSVGVLTEHTRPVEALDTRVLSESVAVLYTADTMGIIRVWDITKEDVDASSPWKVKLVGELKHHRTRVDDMIHGDGHLWTGWICLRSCCLALAHVLMSSVDR